MNCNDFIKTTEMQIYVLYRGMSKSDNKTCYIAYLWYIYSLICSVRKTDMTNTSFDEYYSHTMTDSILLDLYLKLLWETLSQKMKAEKNRWKKTLHEPVKRMKKRCNICTHKKKYNSYSAKIVHISSDNSTSGRGWEGRKKLFVHSCFVLPRVTARWCPACCSWSPTVFHPSCRQRPSLSSSRGHSHWARTTQRGDRQWPLHAVLHLSKRLGRLK